MRIVIIGGHGKVAMLLAPLLTEAGHQVTSLIRNADHRDDVAATGAAPVVADVEHLEADAIAGHLAGHDAVVWSAGAGGGNPARTYAVDRDAAIRSMEAAATAGARRYVMVSYFGAGADHGVPPDSGFFAYAEAKAAADAHLRTTDLAWTILGPAPSRSTPAPGDRGGRGAHLGPRPPRGRGPGGRRRARPAGHRRVVHRLQRGDHADRRGGRRVRAVSPGPPAGRRAGGSGLAADGDRVGAGVGDRALGGGTAHAEGERAVGGDVVPSHVMCTLPLVALSAKNARSWSGVAPNAVQATKTWSTKPLVVDAATFGRKPPVLNMRLENEPPPALLATHTKPSRFQVTKVWPPAIAMSGTKLLVPALANSWGASQPPLRNLAL